MIAKRVFSASIKRLVSARMSQTQCDDSVTLSIICSVVVQANRMIVITDCEFCNCGHNLGVAHHRRQCDSEPGQLPCKGGFGNRLDQARIASVCKREMRSISHNAMRLVKSSSTISIRLCAASRVAFWSSVGTAALNYVDVAQCQNDFEHSTDALIIVHYKCACIGHGLLRTGST